MTPRALTFFISSMCLWAGLVATPPPVELFFKNPEFSDPQISPDGKTLVILAPIGGVMNLVAMDLETRQLKALSGESRDVTWFYWVSEDRLFYGVDSREVTHDAQRVGGAILGVDRDGSRVGTVLDSYLERLESGSSFRPGSRSYGYVDVIHPLRDDPKHVLVTDNARRREEPDVFLMDIYSGRLKRQFNNPGTIGRYLVSPKGEVVGGSGLDLDRDATFVYYRRDPDSGEWSRLAEFSSQFEADWEIEAVDRGGKRALAAARWDNDRTALHWFSLETGEMESKPVVADPVYDVGGEILGAGGGVVLGFRTRAIVGYRYHAEKPKTVYFNDQYAKLQALLDAALPGASNRIVSADRKGTRAVIESISDVKSPMFFLLDLKTLAMEPIAPAFPQIAELELVPTLPIRYEAGDGRTIHGYLTLPKSYRPGSPVPLILNPHGGPYARDTWGIRSYFDLEKQYLASRGFAVLQMDFRGSVGYGRDHEESSFKRLDLMHEDVIDGARWAVAEGYADPARLGIMGASWGGYATMTAIAKEPTMFQFGVNQFGLVDLVTQLNREQINAGPRYGFLNQDYRATRFGDPGIEEERALLEEWSAINYIDDIQARVFIYHGNFDRNVDVEQSNMLADALRRKGWREGEEFVYVKRAGEMHGFYNEEKRIEFYRELDEFLKPFAPAWRN